MLRRTANVPLQREDDHHHICIAVLHVSYPVWGISLVDRTFHRTASPQSSLCHDKFTCAVYTHSTTKLKVTQRDSYVDTNREPCTSWMATTGTETTHESASTMATAMGATARQQRLQECDFFTDLASYKFTDSVLHGCSLC